MARPYYYVRKERRRPEMGSEGKETMGMGQALGMGWWETQDEDPE